MDGPATRFPSAILRNTVCLLLLLSMSVLSFCLARRPLEFPFGPWSWRSWSSNKATRVLVMGDLVLSWLCAFGSAYMIFGAGLSTDLANCTLGVYVCIVLYLWSKIFEYLFLLERMYTLWKAFRDKQRLASTLYRMYIIIFVAYLALAAVLSILRVSYLRLDSTCIIGFGRILSTVGPPARGLIDIWIVWVLVWWLRRKRETISPDLRAILRRTLIFTLIEAATLIANGSVMVALQGAEPGWLCLVICSGDVAISGAALVWLTSSGPSTNHLSERNFQDIYASRPYRRSLPPFYRPPSFVDQSSWRCSSPLPETYKQRISADDLVYPMMLTGAGACSSPRPARSPSWTAHSRDRSSAISRLSRSPTLSRLSRSPTLSVPKPIFISQAGPSRSPRYTAKARERGLSVNTERASTSYPCLYSLTPVHVTASPSPATPPSAGSSLYHTWSKRARRKLDVQAAPPSIIPQSLTRLRSKSLSALPEDEGVPCVVSTASSFAAAPAGRATLLREAFRDAHIRTTGVGAMS